MLFQLFLGDVEREITYMDVNAMLVTSLILLHSVRMTSVEASWIHGVNNGLDEKQTPPPLPAFSSMNYIPTKTMNFVFLGFSGLASSPVASPSLVSAPSLVSSLLAPF